MPFTLPVVNQESATFECIYGRGCDGICCRNGRPSIGPAEGVAIGKVLKRALPLLRPAARERVEAEGITSKRRKTGKPMLRVVDGWCVFFNEGCVLHKIGAQDGDAYRYKPVQCSLFPLDQDEDTGEWYVRQWGFKDEEWDLFCLNPKQSQRKAADSLAAEIEVAERLIQSGAAPL